MNQKRKRAAAGLAILLAAVVMLGIPTFAQTLSKSIDVTFRDIKIFVDGALVIPQDASGKIIEPFIYEGATYLPVRALGEALGKPVEWDGTTNSVYIGESPSREAVEVTVSTAEELLAALGSNRRILLEEGVYNLSSVSPSVINNPSVYFKMEFDGPNLYLNGIHNLTIQGVGDKPSELIVEPRYAFVMNFLNSSEISIANIKAGHSPEGGYCSGGVFSFENSSGIRIDKTLMYGCGTVGLSLLRVTDMEVTDSTIYECTQEIFFIYSSADIRFKNCVFRDNMTYTMVDIWLSSGITIDSCAFLRNHTAYGPNPMFSIAQSERVEIINTKFTENDADQLIAQEEIKFDLSNTFEKNTFD